MHSVHAAELRKTTIQGGIHKVGTFQRSTSWLTRAAARSRKRQENSFRPSYAGFNSTCYHPPRAHPRGFAIFFLAVYSPPPGTQKETIPHPRDSSSTKTDFRTIAQPATRRFDKNLNAFLEFTERRILHGIKKHGHYIEEENRRKKSNRTGILLASKEMFFTACFISTWAKEVRVSKLMTAF